MFSSALTPARLRQIPFWCLQRELVGALDVVAEDYQTHPTNIKISYAASSTLARQLAQGVPVDNISANVVWVKHVEDQQAIQAASKFGLSP